MQHAKKMLLVDPQQQQQPQPEPPKQQQYISEMDKEMQNTLNENIPDDLKAKFYYSILQKYVGRKSDYAWDSTTPMQVEEELLESVPPEVKYKAKRLLRIIRNNPEAEWNSRGEFIYRQRTIPNSHIIDLIGDVLRKSNNLSPPPLGWEEFARMLKSINVPRELVPNTQRWKFITKEEEEERPTQLPTITSSTRKSRRRAKAIEWKSL